MTRYYYDLARVSVANRFAPRRIPRPLRVLFLSDCLSLWNERQFSPFYWFRNALALKLGFVFRLIRMNPMVPPSAAEIRNYDLILLKLFYKTPPEDAEKIAASVSANKHPDAKLVYFDGIDDLCIHWPNILDHVDLCVKRHSFKDPSMYLRRFAGSINLTDYVFKEHGALALNGEIGTSDPVRPENLGKIFCGMTFGMDDNIMKLRGEIRSSKAAHERSTDIICRADVPNTWMGYLRRQIAPILNRMAAKGWSVITPEVRVSQAAYRQEMARSKICVGPFGYGEVCYRDYEAVIFGCLLVKPDMGHAQAYPDIFRANETYVPIAWDYSDLEEKLVYYLNRPEEVRRMTRNASRVLLEAHTEDWFLSQVEAFLKGAGLSR